MKFAPHWARARVDEDGTPNQDNGTLVAFGWSMTSHEDAAEMALRHAKSLAHWLVNMDDDDYLRDPSEYYTNGERPLREPILEAFEAAGVRSAVITRNSYGVRVLNTCTTAFIDIDLPSAPRVKQPGFFARLFGAKPIAVPTRDEQESPILQRIKDVMATHADVGMRLYRTRNGFRGLITSRTYAPTDPEILSLMEELGTDPLYLRLCKVQECFRARLTPKPWRVDTDGPPKNFFPWREGAPEKAHYEAWKASYEAAIRGWSVCKEVKHYGPTKISPDVLPLFRLHEQVCCGGYPLA
jgi:hypothetical protein